MTLDVAPVAAPPRPPAPEVDLATRARADGVRFLLALFVDLTGKPCAKLVPVEAADELQHDGVGFAGYAVGAMGQQPWAHKVGRSSGAPIAFQRAQLASERM